MPTIDSTRQGEYKAFGWMVFAASMLLIVGAANVLQGFLLLARDEIYVSDASGSTVAIGDLNAWGWTLIIVGVIEVAVAAGVFLGKPYARWFGVGISVLAILGQMPLFFGDHPLWSLMVITLSVLVIYGLVMYGDSDDLDL